MLLLRPRMCPRLQRAVSLLLAACILLLAALPLRAQGTVSESAVKAAFLYKFPAFVEWPPTAFPGPNDPLVIAILGNDALAADLEQLVAGRAVQGRPVVARRLREGEPLGAAHVLMVGATRDARLRELADTVPPGVLLVTEQDGALGLGSVLNFTAEGGRVRFSASQVAAEARGLRLSARLLTVAQNVDGRAR